MKINKFILSVSGVLLIAIVVLFAFSFNMVNTDFSEANNTAIQETIDNLDGNTDDNTVHTNTVDDTSAIQPETNDDISVNEPVTNEEEASVDNGRVIDPTKPMVALTFDDGPSPKHTEHILEVLAEYNSVATFFEIGQNAKKYPELILKEIEAGCELGNHSYTHPNLKKITKAEALEEINKTNEVFISITGKPATIIRPPYGAIDDRAAMFSQPVVTWSVDTLDWQSRDADKIMKVIRDEGDLDGKVILMHSTHASSLEAVRELVPYLIENGYQLVTVSELYEYKHGESMEAGVIYDYTYFR